MRLFLAATDELADSRDLVLRAVDSFNRTKSVEERFEVHDWSSWVADQMGAERTPLVTVDPGDVFLGLAWLRFSSPNAGDPDVSVQEYGASTEEEFELAFRSWASAPRSASLFYRCQRLPASLAAIHGEQLARVERFFARFEDGRSPGRYGEYESEAELGKRLVDDLEGVLAAYRESAGPLDRSAGAPVAGTPAAGTPAGDGARVEAPAESQPAYTRKMQPGKAYEVSFLALEVVDFPELSRRHPRESIEILERSFKNLALETAASYGGEIFSWDTEQGRGLLMFWSKRSYDHAIITGLKVIHSLPVFNLDPLQNPLSQNLELRAAAHDAVIVFQMPVAQIASADIDFLLELVGKHTHPGELGVSKRLLERADTRLEPRFKNKGRFEGEPIWACRLPSTEQHALRTNLEEVLGKVKSLTAEIKGRIARPTRELELVDSETISAALDETYALLDRAGQLLGKLDNAWSKKFFNELAGLAHVLVREEGELWAVLRRSHEVHRGAPEIAARLETIVQVASTQRSRPAAMLARTEQGLAARAADEPADEPAAKPAAPRVDQALKKKIETFLRADPLDHEMLLTDLLLHEKTRMIEYLSKPRRDDLYAALRDKLWESADLILLDDLYSIRGHKRAGERRFTDVLTTQPVVDGRFQVVRQLLREEFRPTESLVRQRFGQVGLECENRDLQIAWRSVVLGHPEVKIRTLAAFKMSQFSMWQTIAHPSIPIPSLHAIGERVAKSEGEDAKKIFFDCIRSRVIAAVEEFRTRDELSVITKLILLLLDFPFLVETGYFERFDDVLEKFLSRSHKLGLEVEYFENLRQRLESAKRDTPAAQPGRPPAGITKLPLTIQRRLAGEKHYLSWFVTHPDARIAGETMRHITLSNVERVLRLPEINGAVLSQLLKKPELFTRSGPLLAALNNPKCEIGFANRYLGNLARSRGGLQALEKLARNPSANPAIRSAAGRLVQQRSSAATH